MQPTLTKFDPPSQSFVSLCVGDVGVLVGLGLSVRQACVYLALLRAGVAKVQMVSDLSRVHRQEVHRVLDGLQQMVFVQRRVSSHATFSVTPLSVQIENNSGDFTIHCYKSTFRIGLAEILRSITSLLTTSHNKRRKNDD